MFPEILFQIVLLSISSWVVLDLFLFFTLCRHVSSNLAHHLSKMRFNTCLGGSGLHTQSICSDYVGVHIRRGMGHLEIPAQQHALQ